VPSEDWFLADQEKEGGPKCKTSGPHKLCQSAHYLRFSRMMTVRTSLMGLTYLSQEFTDARCLLHTINILILGVPRGAKADSREFPTIMSRFQLRRYTECCKYSWV